MCGIVGYIGKKSAEKELVTMLKNLEYRGYDSAGIAVINNEIEVTKEEGKISNLESIIIPTSSSIGIAHTRWATHGKPNKVNAHPHLSENKEWAVVHNGIIENFEIIKKNIEENSNIKFVSETDTEVIPQALQYYKQDTYINTFIEACKKLKGSFAIACLNKNLPDTLFLAKNKSPLYIAKTHNEVIVASDPICFVGKSKEYYSLDDDEFCLVSANNITFYDNKYNIIAKSTIVLNELAETFGKQEFEHFMLKEINEIPSVLSRIVKTYRDNNPFKKIDKSKFNKVVIVGCGTAYHAGLMGGKYLEKISRIECSVHVASEFRYTNPIIDEKTLCIFVSQSGETADTLGAEELAKSKGCTTVALTNVLYSTLAKTVDIILPVCAGPEIAVASTKAYNAQLAIFYMLAKYLKDEKVDYLYDLENLANLIKLPHNQEIEELSKELARENTAFFIGRDYDYITAIESSLKVKEITYINSNAYPSGELKHGFLALVEKDSYLFVIATEQDLLDKTLNGAYEAYSRGAKVIIATQLDIPQEKLNFVYKTLKLQNFDEDIMPIVSVITFQMLAYYTSVAKSLNPDQPRNLAKSVTVE